VGCPPAARVSVRKREHGQPRRRTVAIEVGEGQMNVASADEQVGTYRLRASCVARPLRTARRVIERRSRAGTRSSTAPASSLSRLARRDPPSRFSSCSALATRRAILGANEAAGASTVSDSVIAPNFVSQYFGSSVGPAIEVPCCNRGAMPQASPLRLQHDRDFQPGGAAGPAGTVKP